MKKALVISGLIFTLAACSNNSTDRGVQDDGIKMVDKNGGLPDTSKKSFDPKTDTAMGEDRVDIQKRDSTQK